MGPTYSNQSTEIMAKEAALIARFFLAFVAFVPLFMHSQAAVWMDGFFGGAQEGWKGVGCVFFFFFGACESWSIIACLYFLGWTTPGTPPRICQSIDRSVYSYQPADITRFAHNFEHVSFEQYNTGAGGVFLFTGTLPHVWSKWYNYHVLYLVTLTFGSSVFRVILLVTWLNSTLAVLLSQVYTDKHLDDPRMYIWFSMMRFRWKHRETHIASGQHIVYKHVESLISVQMFDWMYCFGSSVDLVHTRCSLWNLGISPCWFI